MAKKSGSFLSLVAPVWPLVILRVAIGYWFLKFGNAKYTGMRESAKLIKQLSGIAKDIPAGWHPWYHSLLTHYIAPHAPFFAYLISFGELAVGVALIVGLLTRPAMLAAMFMNINYHLASGYKPGASGFVNLIFIWAELSLLFTPVGRCLGCDYFLQKRFPKQRFLF